MPKPLKSSLLCLLLALLVLPATAWAQDDADDADAPKDEEPKVIHIETQEEATKAYCANGKNAKHPICRKKDK